jgi:collagenase-like PrtC family protease
LHVHDGFSGVSWCGGRERGSTIEPAVLDDVIDQYRRRDVGFNLLFSSHLLGPDDLADEYGNLLLEKLHDERNGVVVCDGVLADYVRERYPKYRRIRSVVNAYLDEVIYRRPGEIVRYFEEKMRQYDRVVVPSELNLRFEILDQLDKSKLEFLVNNNCFWHCPFSRKHYTAIARGFKNTGGSGSVRVCLARTARGPEQDRVFEHLHKHQGLYDESGKLIKKLKRGKSIVPRKSWMTYEHVALMQRKGCVHFKLQGRDLATADFQSVLRQFVIQYDD